MNKDLKSPVPPRWSHFFMRLFLKKEFLEEIEGDMEEVFQENLETLSVKRARTLYNKEVFKLIRPNLVRKLSGNRKLNLYGMLQHNLILSLRIFRRYKSSFLINLTGLSTGMACVLMIFLWVNDEMGIDRFHSKKDRLFQVMGNHDVGGTINTWNGTSAQLAGALKEETPEVESAISATDPSWNIGFDLVHEETKIKTIGTFAGKDFFNFFSYDLLQGDREQVLSTPDQVAISETLAINLFGDPGNAVGKTLEWSSMNTSGNTVVSGVFSSPPANSTAKFDFVLPFEAYTKDFGDQWQNPNSVTYVLLKEDARADAVNAKIVDFVKTKVPDSNKTIFLKKYADQYLYGRYENGVEAGGRIEYVRLFSIIAVFILLIACINFMNLSTARASRRVKEVGIKKAVGASRPALIFQHLSESMLMSFISLIIAVFLVYLVLPQFNLITGKSLQLSLDTTLIVPALVITAITGLLSGSYPALYLSKFNPSVVLKGVLKGSSGELWVRKGLVIFQFTLTIIFIMGVLVVYKQMDYIQSKNLGFDKDHIIYFEREGNTVENLEPFLAGLKELPGVEEASAINNDFFSAPGAGDFSWEGKLDENVDIKRYMVYYDFINTIGAELKEGRDFSREFPLKDEWQIILNEKAVEVMGLEEPIGMRAKLWGLNAEIIGVVKDFHFKSLHETVGPMFFNLNPRFLVNTMVRIKAGTEQETLARIQSFYEDFNPGYTFNYKFLDQDFQALYDSELKVASLSRYFAGFAIIISSLGLLGLVSFSAERRLKEIGIRKVLGSGNLSIMLMLSRDFSKMVALAIILGLPISYYFAQMWLNDFAYPIALKWWFFAITGMSALIIAWLTVSFQTIKVAAVNPVECLRNE